MLHRRQVAALLSFAVLASILSACGRGVDAPEPMAPSPTQGEAAIEVRGSDTPQVELIPSIPDAPLSSEGPWWVFASDNGLWAVNQDGSGLTHILDRSGPGADARAYRIEPSPIEGKLAVVEIENKYKQTSPILELLYLPGGELEMLTPLYPAGYDPSGYPDSFDRWAATGQWNQISWSPDGEKLAFNAVIDGESGDLYTYELETGAMGWLTSGPTEAVRPTWSPDGKMIVHGAVERLNIESSGSGFDYHSVWSAAADGSLVNLLYNSDVTGFEDVLGWFSTQEALIDTDMPNDNPFCSYRDLRVIDVWSSVTRIVLQGRYAARAYDPESQTVLFSVTEEAPCDQTLSPGIYILDVGEQRPPLKIVEDVSYEIEWSLETGLFFAETDHGALAISRLGDFIDLVVPEDAYRSPLAAPGTKTIAWRSMEGLWIGTLQDSLESGPRKIFSDWVQDMSWSPDGEHLLFKTLDEIFVASAPIFTPVSIVEIRGRFPTWVFGPEAKPRISRDTSLSSPAPLGYSIYDGALRITILDVVSPADDVIQADSAQNSPPPAGSQYLLVRMALKCSIIETTCVLFDDVLFQAIDSTGAAHPAVQDLEGIPDLLEAQSIAGGRRVEVVLIFAVPASEQEFMLMYSRPMSGDFYFDLE